MRTDPGWRKTIADASAGVPTAYMRRREVMRAASRAGLTLREIADAASMSRNAVSQIVGPVRQGREEYQRRMEWAA